MNLKTIKICDKENTISYYVNIEKPKYCPFCHTGIDSLIETRTTFTHSQDGPSFAVVFRCPICHNHFLGSYIFYPGSSNTSESTLINVSPTPKLNIEISKDLKEFSPKFARIYIQALTAQQYGLDEVVGIGLRKSIEFLIKDYLIHFKKKNKDKISEMQLGSLFKELQDERLNPLITSIAWLGNDESHYIRKFENHDIEDMKDFITALIHFVSCDLSVEKAKKIIESRKK